MKKHPISFLRISGVVSFVFVVMVFLSGCAKEEMTTTTDSSKPIDNPIKTNIPTTPDAIPQPDDNIITPEKVELGKHLFFDKALSVDNSTACSSCHQVSHGFSDIFPTSMGLHQQHGTRNAPALANIAYNKAFTWDGRFKSLEEHAPGPMFNSVEMGNNFSTTAQDTVPNGYNSGPGPNDTNFLFKRLMTNHGPDMSNQTYSQLFKNAWGSDKLGPNGVSLDHIAKAIACFERTIISSQSAFDKYNNGDKNVFKYNNGNADPVRGFQLFSDANGANCISCHSGYNFTDQQFHDNGIGLDAASDKGRFNITTAKADIGKFKTPSLRNVALTAPYMHDGSLATLDAVLKHYNSGGKTTDNKDPKIHPLNLSQQDIDDIIAFLQSLTDDNFVMNTSNRFTNPWTN